MDIYKVSGAVNAVEERAGNKGTVAGQTDDMSEAAMTGDGQDLTVWLALILTSGTGTLGVAAYRKKRKTIRK